MFIKDWVIRIILTLYQDKDSFNPTLFTCSLHLFRFIPGIKEEACLMFHNWTMLLCQIFLYIPKKSDFKRSGLVWLSLWDWTRTLLNARITAYVVKVFSMAYTIIGIDKQQVCDPLLYLLRHKFQASPGIFIETNPVYSTTMTVRHTHTHISLLHLCSNLLVPL